MGFFNRKPKTSPLEDIAIEVVPNNTDDKQKFKEAAEEARAINEKFNSQLLANGFTIKIFVAAGGTPKKKGNK